MKKTLCALLCVCLTALLFAGCGAVGATIPASVITGTDYHSDFTGLNCSLTGDWVYKTDSEIEQMMGIGEGTLRDGDNYSKTACSAAGIYDMVAVNSLTGTTVAVLIENVSKVKDGKNMDAEAFLETKVDDYIAQSTGDVETHPLENITLSGTVYPARPLICRASDSTSYMVFYAIKKDDYFITVQYTSLFEISAGDLAELFAA